MVEACLNVLETAALGIDEVGLGRAAVSVAGHDHKRGLLVVSALGATGC
ncbi:hypothetical protein [Azospirillum argentinense]